MTKKPTSDQLIDELLDLYSDLLVPYMKIRRDMPFPTESDRQETDGEHSFTLAMVAITLSERLNSGLDSGLLAKYALIHDLVEVHAGDLSVRASEAEHRQKVDREHEAFLVIQEKFLGHAPWIAREIEAYEARGDEESNFVYACDKLMGALTRITGNGENWADYYPEESGDTYHRVVERLRAKAQTYPPLLDLFDMLHTRLDVLRPEYLRKDLKRRKT
jgi:5'-deoxynucleotidase YfbR-like HD superfamily hydrolase